MTVNKRYLINMSNSEQFECNQVCRTCLSTVNLKLLYDEHCLADMLMFCTPVEYRENDGLSIQICVDCIKQLNRCYEFALKCQESDVQLRTYVQQFVPQEYAKQQRSNMSCKSLKDPLAPFKIENELNHELVFIKDEPDISPKCESDSDKKASVEPMMQQKLDEQAIYQLYHSTTKTLCNKSGGKGSGRMYHEEWFYKFGVIEKNCKSFCIICNNTVVTRSYNVKRHFQTNHKNLVSLSSEDKHELFSKKLIQYHNQRATNTHIAELPPKKSTTDIVASMKKKNAKMISKAAGSGRQYHADWYCKFGVVEKAGKAFCIICNNTVVSRTYNVKRHFESHHKHLIGLTNDERIVYFSQLKELEHKFIDSSGDNEQKLPLEIVLLH